MARETSTLHLPTSKLQVEVVAYFTLDEDDQIHRYGMEGAEAVVEVDDATGEEQLKIRKIPVDRNRREIRKMLEVGILSASRDGEQQSVGAAFVSQLPRQDVEVLVEHLVKVRAGDERDPKAQAGT